MTRDDATGNRPAWIDRILVEGLIVGSVVVVAAAWGYSFEAGYNERMMLPMSLVTLDATTFRFGTLYLGVMVLAGVLFYLALASGQRPRSSKSWLRRWALASVTAGFLFVCLFGLLVHRQAATWFTTGRIAMILGVELALVSFWAAAVEFEVRPALLGALAVATVATSTYVAQQVGDLNARAQKLYLITDTRPEQVVLRINGDTAICAPFDRGAKTATAKFTFVKLGENGSMAFRMENVGPITMKEHSD